MENKDILKFILNYYIIFSLVVMLIAKKIEFD